MCLYFIFYVASLTAILPIATDVTVVRLIISVALVHPAKAAGRNEMPFGRDTRAGPSNTVLDRGPGPTEGEFWGSEPLVRSDVAYRQITVVLVCIDLCKKCTV